MNLTAFLERTDVTNWFNEWLGDSTERLWKTFSAQVKSSTTIKPAISSQTYPWSAVGTATGIAVSQRLRPDFLGGHAPVLGAELLYKKTHNTSYRMMVLEWRSALKNDPAFAYFDTYRAVLGLAVLEGVYRRPMNPTTVDSQLVEVLTECCINDVSSMLCRFENKALLERYSHAKKLFLAPTMKHGDVIAEGDLYADKTIIDYKTLSRIPTKSAWIKMLHQIIAYAFMSEDPVANVGLWLMRQGVLWSFPLTEVESRHIPINRRRASFLDLIATVGK